MCALKFDELDESIDCVGKRFRKCFNEFYKELPSGYCHYSELLLSMCEKEQRLFLDRYPDLMKAIDEKFRYWCTTKSRYCYMMLILSDKVRSFVFPNIIIHALRNYYGEEYGYLSLAEDDLAYRLGYDDETLVEDVKNDVLFEMVNNKTIKY